LERQAVSSTNIKSVGYDPARRVLEIEFISGGVHEYEDVPPDLPPKMMASDSVGRFFHQHVRNRYSSRPVSAA
jgi:hypothetical protein